MASGACLFPHRIDRNRGENIVYDHDDQFPSIWIYSPPCVSGSSMISISFPAAVSANIQIIVELSNKENAILRNS